MQLMDAVRGLAAALVLATAGPLRTLCAAEPAPAPILLKGGLVVNADGTETADVLVEKGVIARVAPDISAPAGAKIIDVRGKYVMPGGIDPHTHLEMPFMGQTAADDFYSGQAAALAGGTTFHIDFALPDSGDLLSGYETYRRKAAKSCMDYGFHMAVTKWDDKVSRDMGTLVAKGVNSFKFFLAYKGALMVSDEEFIHGLVRCKELGALTQVHAENGDAVVLGQEKVTEAGITGPRGHGLSRPAILEGEATGRAIRLARFVNTPIYVVHVMSQEALDEVKRGRAQTKGDRVIGEAVVSGFSLDGSMMEHSDFKVAAQYVMSPPIRTYAKDGVALQTAILDGDIQLVATDHAVFNSTQKAAGVGDFRVIPNGVNGIEERMILTYFQMVVNAKLSLSDYVRVTSTAAAKIFNVFPRKGHIAVGSDADIIVLDPSGRTTLSAATHHSRMDTNVYEGWECSGKIETTISRGRLVWHEGTLDVKEGSGRFVPMQPFSYVFDGIEEEDAAKPWSFQAKDRRPPADHSEL